eukprot:1212956-Prymnesium_polylepis.1
MGLQQPCGSEEDVGVRIADPSVTVGELREESGPHWLEVAQLSLDSCAGRATVRTRARTADPPAQRTEACSARLHVPGDRNRVERKAEVALDEAGERGVAERQPTAVGRQAGRADKVEEDILVGGSAHDDRTDVIRPRAELQVEQAREVAWSVAAAVDGVQQPLRRELEPFESFLDLQPRHVEENFRCGRREAARICVICAVRSQSHAVAPGSQAWVLLVQHLSQPTGPGRWRFLLAMLARCRSARLVTLAPVHSPLLLTLIAGPRDAAADDALSRRRRRCGGGMVSEESEEEEAATHARRRSRHLLASQPHLRCEESHCWGDLKSLSVRGPGGARTQ